jgi:hypothetical protein
MKQLQQFLTSYMGTAMSYNKEKGGLVDESSIIYENTSPNVLQKGSLVRICSHYTRKIKKECIHHV